MDCYGRQYHKLPQCQACELASYCQDAADLPLTGRRCIPIDEMPEAEGSTAEVDEAANTESSTVREAAMAADLKAILIALVQAANGREATLGIILDRIAGLSYEQIASKRGITKQAVHRQMSKIEQSSPILHEFLVALSPSIPIPACEFMGGDGRVVRLNAQSRRPSKSSNNDTTAYDQLSFDL